MDEEKDIPEVLEAPIEEAPIAPSEEDLEEGDEPVEETSYM